jgi:hypothetical protein
MSSPQQSMQTLASNAKESTGIIDLKAEIII